MRPNPNAIFLPVPPSPSLYIVSPNKLTGVVALSVVLRAATQLHKGNCLKEDEHAGRRAMSALEWWDEMKQRRDRVYWSYGSEVRREARMLWLKMEGHCTRGAGIEVFLDGVKDSLDVGFGCHTEGVVLEFARALHNDLLRAARTLDAYNTKWSILMAMWDPHRIALFILPIRSSGYTPQLLEVIKKVNRGVENSAKPPYCGRLFVQSMI